ncbi:S1C family serine protease [Gordonia neofelifaecis]|uniref:Peptidase S1 and S6 chymotrypsin/Hap n=1 Tax=Gordonia neofelifaecis NRRL B-59395 TaxID=644548 RepID=F1YKR2_9ACTN|nr:trypsin-like peptidase domain-containing protein [Gordonia neofelifaecis]EGD54706.1 peptidase S1 and S6 chymotrypsin/Hap [Gordonia neofelifaecis NRRL B-59395]
MTNGEHPGNDDWRQVPGAPNQPPTGGFPANPYGPPSNASGPPSGQFAAANPNPPQPGAGTPSHGQHATPEQPSTPYYTGAPSGPGSTGQFAAAGYGTQPFPGGDPVNPAVQPPAPQQPKKGGAGKKFIVGAAAVALLAGGAGGAIGASLANGSDNDSSTSNVAASGPTDTAQPPAAPGSVQSTSAAVLPSVVSITVEVGNQVGSGSGVILSDDGVILTNNHVISAGGGKPADKILVSFNDGTRAMAKVLGTDPTSDIAVIQADKTGLKPITVGSSANLSVGQEVIAVGSPLGLEGTVTTGIISSLNRPVSTTGADGSVESVMDAIQTDAAINPGNSGGALVNGNGALIGINSAIATVNGASEQQQSGSIGLGFAIPVDQAMRIANTLRTGGKVQQASLGVNVRPSSDVTQPGAQVVNVVSGGAADQAGIPKGAVITQVDDRKIASSDALVAAIRSYAPGDTVKITYVIDGQTKTADVKLGAS